MNVIIAIKGGINPGRTAARTLGRALSPSRNDCSTLTGAALAAVLLRLASAAAIQCLI
jgi:hypothetical protein